MAPPQWERWEKVVFSDSPFSLFSPTTEEVVIWGDSKYFSLRAFKILCETNFKIVQTGE